MVKYIIKKGDKSMKVFGIDPGIATVGFGVVDYTDNKFRLLEYGTVTTPPKLELSVRLEGIYDELLRLIGKHEPDAVSVEELFFNTNVTTAISVAHGRGVALLAAKKSGRPVYEYTPLQVKQAVTGYGRAEKAQVMEMVRMFLGLQKVPRPDDAADALAVAICHAHSARSALFENITAR